MSNPGSVRITKHGRAAIIHHVEDGGSYDFDAELGGGKVLLVIYAPRDDGEWARRLPWAAGRRNEVLERVAREVVRQEARGSRFIVHPGGVDILMPSPMHVSDNPSLRPLFLAAILYGVVGIVTARLAGATPSPQMRTTWRLAAWLLSLATFFGHVTFERRRLRAPVRKAATYVDLPVGARFGKLVAKRDELGVVLYNADTAFAWAGVGPVRMHWGGTDFRRVIGLSVVLWPIMTGVPAFLAALVAGSIVKPGRQPS